ncbi:MAG: DNA-binding protein WhiA [Veillonellaceae bacterium]|nr:DNA-binding protein WhiA [Veillonellaceae bacterium]
MSFAEDVKNELCQYEVATDRVAQIELSAILRGAASLVLGMKDRVGLNLVTTNNAVARRALFLLRQQFPSLVMATSVRKGLRLRKKNTYTVSLQPSKETKEVLEVLRLWPLDAEPWLGLTKKMEEGRAFLRGAFLGGGSVNRPESDYHLEFMTSQRSFAEQILAVLKSFHSKAGLTERKEHYVVYLKEGDAVTNCLQVMGAGSAVMDFENVRIVKGVRNRINRQVNCETANLQKAVNAAVRQLECVRIIARHQPLSQLTPKLQEAAQIRQRYPDATMQELVEHLDMGITKSGLAHRFRKLEKLALSFEPDGLDVV